MITVTVRDNDFRVVSLEMTGHANYAEHGSDIVCAAVSALVLTTVNSIERLASYQPVVEVDEQNGGYLYFETLTNLTSEQEYITHILLQNLLYGLEDIQEQYASYLSISFA